MITLENIYTSDIQDVLDWYKAYRNGCIPATLNEKFENVLARFETDLHNISLGKAKIG